MKLAITHTKKVPGQEDYSSEGFGATIEVELPDDQAQDAASVQGYLQELYEQAKAAVEEQLRSVPRRNGSGNGAQGAAGLFRPNGGNRSVSPGNGGQTASPKQISFLVSLGARNRMTFADLQRMAQDRFRVEDLYQLDRSAASALIDELKGEGVRR